MDGLVNEWNGQDDLVNEQNGQDDMNWWVTCSTSDMDMMT